MILISIELLNRGKMQKKGEKHAKSARSSIPPSFSSNTRYGIRDSFSNCKSNECQEEVQARYKKVSKGTPFESSVSMKAAGWLNHEKRSYFTQFANNGKGGMGFQTWILTT